MTRLEELVEDSHRCWVENVSATYYLSETFFRGKKQQPVKQDHTHIQCCLSSVTKNENVELFLLWGLQTTRCRLRWRQRRAQRSLESNTLQEKSRPGAALWGRPRINSAAPVSTETGFHGTCGLHKPTVINKSPQRECANVQPVTIGRVRGQKSSVFRRIWSLCVYLSQLSHRHTHATCDQNDVLHRLLRQNMVCVVWSVPSPLSESVCWLLENA